MSDFPREWMSPIDFVNMAKLILGDNKKYEDDIIIIDSEPFASRNELIITRKALTEGDHLRVSNPVTMVYDKEIIRHHGEHCYLVPHMKNLIKEKFNI